jgi:mediator of RNA polymerase II transcription subunit 17
MSENLTKLAQKIDFSKTGPEDIKKEVDADKSDEEGKDSLNSQSSLWPWDSVRNKLRYILVHLDIFMHKIASAYLWKYPINFSNILPIGKVINFN